jgi:hypothetical protein
MTKKPVKQGRKGRPKIEIDWGEFEKLCQIQCTLAEIADWFKCSEDTIERRCREQKKMLFAEYFKKHSVKGRISLRRSQFKLATGGNPALNIWLGKQYLGQRDQPGDSDEIMKPTPVSVTIQVEDASD